MVHSPERNTMCGRQPTGGASGIAGRHPEGLCQRRKFIMVDMQAAPQGHIPEREAWSVSKERARATVDIGNPDTVAATPTSAAEWVCFRHRGLSDMHSTQRTAVLPYALYCERRGMRAPTCLTAFIRYTRLQAALRLFSQSRLRSQPGHFRRNPIIPSSPDIKFPSPRSAFSGPFPLISLSTRSFAGTMS